MTAAGTIDASTIQQSQWQTAGGRHAAVRRRSEGAAWHESCGCNGEADGVSGCDEAAHNGADEAAGEEPRASQPPAEMVLASIAGLSTLLADTVMLGELYRKHAREAGAEMTTGLKMLFERHGAEQARLIEVLADLIDWLSGGAESRGTGVARTARVGRGPLDCESMTARFETLVRAHEIILQDANAISAACVVCGDDAAIQEVVLSSTLQIWFVQRAIQNLSRSQECESLRKSA